MPSGPVLWFLPAPSPSHSALLNLFPVDGRWWVTYGKGSGEWPASAGRHRDTTAAWSHTEPSQGPHRWAPQNHDSTKGAQTDHPPPRDTRSYTGGQPCHKGPRCPSMPLAWPAQALPQAWSTCGQGGGECREPLGRAGHAPAWLPSCSLPSPWGVVFPGA